MTDFQITFSIEGKLKNKHFPKGITMEERLEPILDKFADKLSLVLLANLDYDIDDEEQIILIDLEDEGFKDVEYRITGIYTQPANTKQEAKDLFLQKLNKKTKALFDSTDGTYTTTHLVEIIEGS